MWRSSLLLAALLVGPAAALYSKGDAVVQLTGDKAFDTTIVDAEGVSVVEFYAPWCGHCKNLAPHYKTVAQKLKGIVTLAAVDCDDSANKKLCSRNGVKGFPTVKLFGAEKKKNPYTGEWYREAADFQGTPSAKGLMDAATSLLTNTHITKVTSVADFETFMLSRPSVAKVMLFTSKKETPVMFKGLSMQLHRGLDFAEVHQDVADVVAMHEVQDFPTLIVNKDGSSEAYQGDLKAPLVAQFLQGFASAPAEGEEPASAEDEARGEASKSNKEKKVKTQEIKNLTLDEAIELDSQEDMWLLGLYRPAEGSDCAEAVAEYKQLVLDMQDVVKAALVAVSPEEVDTVSRYGASPSKLRSQGCSLQLVLLPFGEGKEDSEDYSVYHGALDGKSLQKWVTDAIPSTFVAEVSASSFQYFATSPPPGAPESVLASLKALVRVLLFTNKDEAPGVFKALATNFRASGLGFGWVQSTSKQNGDLMAQFGVSKVPAVVFVAYTPDPQKPEGDEEGKTTMKPSLGQYRGAMKYNGMAGFMDTLVEAFLPAVPTGEEAEALALPEVAGEGDFEALCTGKGGICVLAVLDPRRERHVAERKLLADLAMQRKAQPFSFCWIDGAKFRGVAAAFGLLRSDLPALVALSAKRLRYSTLPVATDTAGVVTFLNGVLSGKARTEPLQRLPAVVEGGGDGSDEEPEAAREVEAEAQLVEEEFDLSDILGVEVDAADLVSKEERLKQADEEIEAEEEARKAAATKKTTKKSKKKSKKTKSKGGKSEL